MGQRKTIDVWDIQLRKLSPAGGWYTHHTEYTQELALAYRAVMADGWRRNRIVKRRKGICFLNEYERLRSGIK
jgi:hypothetical protein